MKKLVMFLGLVFTLNLNAQISDFKWNELNQSLSIQTTNEHNIEYFKFMIWDRDCKIPNQCRIKLIAYTEFPPIESLINSNIVYEVPLNIPNCIEGLYYAELSVKMKNHPKYELIETISFVIK